MLFECRFEAKEIQTKIDILRVAIMVRTHILIPVLDQILLLKHTYCCKNQEGRQSELVYFKIRDHDFYPTLLFINTVFLPNLTRWHSLFDNLQLEGIIHIFNNASIIQKSEFCLNLQPLRLRSFKNILVMYLFVNQ